jgi:esterase/lipase superfamily enzyme
MYKITLLAILTIGIQLIMTGQNLHYIKILGEDKVAFGTFDNVHLKKTKTGKFLLKDITEADLQTHLHLDSSRKTIVFIHGWLSHFPPFDRHGIAAFKKMAESRPDIQAVNIIEIIWRPHRLFYTRSWKHAPRHGKNLNQLVQKIAEMQNGNLILACHSMGHRVLQGVLENWQMPTHQPIFEKILFFAPDLDCDAFEHAFKDLPSQTPRLTVYRNEKDRSLFFSRWFHGRKRLGRHGFSNPPVAANVEVVNMTKNRDQRRDIIRHIYHQYPAVQQDAALIMANDFEKRKIVKGETYELILK